MKITLCIFILNFVLFSAVSQARMNCTDQNLPKNLPNYEDLPACAIPEGLLGRSFTERVIQIGSLYPRILELSKFMELRHWEYPAEAVNSVLHELSVNDQLNQEGLQKKLRRMQFNADSELVAHLEKWVKVLSIQNYINNELGPAFDYLKDYKVFLERDRLSYNKRPSRSSYWWKAKYKIDLLLSYSLDQSNCAFYNSTNCEYRDPCEVCENSEPYSLVYFTPLEAHPPNHKDLSSATIVKDALGTDYSSSEVAPEMISIISNYSKVNDQKNSLQKAVVNTFQHYFIHKNRSCMDNVSSEFHDLWDSNIQQEVKDILDSKATFFGLNKFSLYSYNAFHIERPFSRIKDLRRLSNWIVGTNKVIKHIEQALFEFNNILSHFKVIKQDPKGFSNSWRILSQDILNIPNSPSDLIAYLEVDSLTLPPSSIYSKKAILDILRSAEKIRYLYDNNFLAVIYDHGIQQFFSNSKSRMSQSMKT
jgi:hypothetical protein